MQQNAFREGGVQIAELLPKIVSERGEPIVGVIDRLTADFALAPFPGGRPAVMALLSAAGFRMSAKPCGFCQSTA